MTTPLTRLACPTCGHTLAFASLAAGSILEAKCKACGAFSVAIASCAGVVILAGRASAMIAAQALEAAPTT